MEEAEQLVLEGVIKVIIRASFVIFLSYLPKDKTELEELLRNSDYKCARDQNTLLAYAKSIQDRCIKNNNDRKEYVPIEGYHTNQQSTIGRMVQDTKYEIQDVVPASDELQKIYSDGDYGDCSENFLKRPSNTCNRSSKIPESYKSRVPLELLHTNVRSLKFIENILALRDEIKRRSSTCPTLLHKMLYDEAEHLSQPFGPKSADHIKQLSEDSGICSEGNFSETCSVIIKGTPTGVLSNVLRSTNPNTAVLEPLECILDYIKTDIDLKAKEVFESWKNSEVEVACTIVGKSCQMGFHYEEIVHIFIVDFLQDIWSNRQISDCTKWSCQICIVKELLTTPSICLEVLYFLTDILDDVTMAINNGCCTSLMITKIAMFLDLFPIMARTLNELTEVDSKKLSHKEKTVTKLWQEKFGTGVRVNYGQELIQRIKIDIIPKLVGFLTSTIDKEPTISLATKEALEELKMIETHTSQYSL